MRGATKTVNSNENMGGFIGHVIAGTAFLFISVWWFIGEILEKGRRRGTARAGGSHPQFKKEGTRFKPIQTPVWYLCRGPTISKIPVEPMAKVILAVIGVLVELPFAHSATLIGEDGELLAKNLPNYGHAMMYAFFGLSGVVDLVMWYNILPLPPKFDYLVFSLAFWVEGFLFYFHLHARNELNVRLHTILYIIVFVTAIVFFLAAISDQFLPFMGFVKVYLLSLQGTWFIQIAFVLFGPNPWENVHKNVEFTGIVVAIHALVLFAIHLTGQVIVYDTYIKKRQSNGRLLENSSGEEDDYKPNGYP